VPKRTDISKILIIGSGPIIIGQACEFDYSGAQACKALKEEGYEIVLVNSNPATIMTDPAMADRTYVEPLNTEVIEKIIQKERPNAVLSTLGGQTALNLSIKLSELGIFEKYNVEMLGVNADIIQKAEDRNLFKESMEKIGLDIPRSGIANTLEESKKIANEIGFPCIVRPAFTLGGTGGGLAYNVEELEQIAKEGIEKSIISEVLIEESIAGWKEYELEVMRDKNDNVVIICTIENLDPMGVHTGDSITVAPAQTLTDVEYQNMRNAGIKIIREIGVETGGSNIQFAINPENGRMIVIEMNPRVSRSSALASKATGFPIAKLAAKLAVGYTLDELDNDITQKTPACFEPTLDYVVCKFPRFNFEKFKPCKPTLGVSMKAVGEAMSIGRTFKESFQKGLRSLETKRFGLGFDGKDFDTLTERDLINKLSTPTPERLFYVQHAFKVGYTLENVFQYTKIDPWFLYHIQGIVNETNDLQFTPDRIKELKQTGFSDRQLAHLFDKPEKEIRSFRIENGITPVYKLVDTCAAEFEAYTPYYYSTYDEECESRITTKEKVMILGGGPNRIGQGIEFDYCCVHASYASREEGYESIMVNSNPETVSTDFDSSDKLYFEPLTFEDVMNIHDLEKPKGVIVQFGGQTPLNLANDLEAAGVTILGTSPDSIDRAEDRERFKQLLQKLNLKQPSNGTAFTLEQAFDVVERIGYPCVVRPSYVLGGASMKIVYSDEELKTYISQAKDVSPSHPILLDQFLVNAIEVDVDAISDGNDCVVAGIMEHIEEAGIHSGDSACSLPPYSLSKEIQDEIRKATSALAKELNVKGLLNIQYAIKDDELFVIEVNPRGSRTVPFVSKATGIPWANLATKIMLGSTIKGLNIKEIELDHVSVKEAVLPFSRFPGVDILLGPEMKSTGEVMGADKTFEMAFLKAMLASGQTVPTEGKIFLSVRNEDKEGLLPYAKQLEELGYEISATAGTHEFLKNNGVNSVRIKKIAEGRPNVVDHIINDEILMVFATASGDGYHEEEKELRQAALTHGVTTITTLSACIATVRALKQLRENPIEVKSLQEYHLQGAIA